MWFIPRWSGRLGWEARRVRREVQVVHQVEVCQAHRHEVQAVHRVEAVREVVPDHRQPCDRRLRTGLRSKFVMLKPRSQQLVSSIQVRTNTTRHSRS